MRRTRFVSALILALGVAIGIVGQQNANAETPDSRVADLVSGWQTSGWSGRGRSALGCQGPADRRVARRGGGDRSRPCSAPWG